MSNYKDYHFQYFCNSLLREIAPKYISETSSTSIKINNYKNQILELSLEKFSILGKHIYKDEHFINQKKINNKTTVDWLINFASDLWDINSEEKNIFIMRLNQSKNNVTKIITDRKKNLNDSHNTKKNSLVNFIDTESSLYLGHSFHPYPKSREGMSSNDFKIYSPEYSHSFSLMWALADNNIIVHRQIKKESENINDNLINNELFKKSFTYDELKEFSIDVEDIENQKLTPIPIHPWQYEHLIKNDCIQSYIQTNQLIFIKSNKKQWRSTSSVRSIYSKEMPYMLKFSLTLRLTNSIRHLQEEEVIRGLQVSQVLKTKSGKDFQKKFPFFEIMQEPAYSAIKDQSGKILKESIVSYRDNIFYKSNDENVCLLAFLNQKSPEGKYFLETLEVKDNYFYKLWFDKFINICILPLLDAQANFGIYLGAHQQNLLLKLDNDGFHYYEIPF